MTKSETPPSLREQMREDGLQPHSLEEVQQHITRALNAEGTNKPEIVERIATVIVSMGFNSYDVLTEEHRLHLSRLGLGEGFGIEPNYHERHVLERALEQDPKNPTLLERLAKLPGVEAFQAMLAERKEQRAKDQAELDKKVELARAAQVMDEKDRLAETLEKAAAIDQFGMKRVRAEQSQEPVVQRAIRAVQELVIPKRATREFDRQVERTTEPLRVKRTPFGVEVVGGTVKQRAAASFRLQKMDGLGMLDD